MKISTKISFNNLENKYFQNISNFFNYKYKPYNFFQKIFKRNFMINAIKLLRIY